MNRGLIAACGLGVGVSWSITNVGAIAETMAAHYDIALASVGLFTTVLFLAEVLSMLPGGRLIDGVGAWHMGMMSLGLVLAGSVVALAFDHVAPALAIRFVVGIGVGIGFVADTAYVGQLGGSPLAQGIYGGLALGTGGVALAIIPPLEGALDWRAPYVVSAVGAAIGVAFLLAGPRLPGRPHEDGRMLPLLTDRRVLQFAAVQSATFGLGIVLSNWVVTILEERGGVSEDTAGAIGALILVMGIIVRPLGGLAIHRRPERARALLTVAMLIGALGTVLVGLADPIPLAAVGAALIGSAAGVPFAATIFGLGRSFPDRRGSAFAAVNTYAIMTIVIGTPLVGLTFDLPGDGLIGFLAAAALWAATVFALPPASAFGVPERGAVAVEQ